MLRMMITEMLEELGHRVTAEAARLKQALPLARSADFDLAVLDVNIAGQLITPVAELIASRQLPIIFATGYGVSGLTAKTASALAVAAAGWPLFLPVRCS